MTYISFLITLRTGFFIYLTLMNGHCFQQLLSSDSHSQIKDPTGLFLKICMSRPLPQSLLRLVEGVIWH